tara:strand:+ start:2058 stop:2261 length:204 start_codon:yes stop_codon:yes gene_type:complete
MKKKAKKKKVNIFKRIGKVAKKAGKAIKKVGKKISTNESKTYSRNIGSNVKMELPVVGRFGGLLGGM